jgi:predicted  nucleic acid-binding Zn-ribbon protein
MKIRSELREIHNLEKLQLQETEALRNEIHELRDDIRALSSRVTKGFQNLTAEIH